GLVTHFPAPLRRLAKACWPGPLTLLLPRTERIPDLVTAGKPRVAIRIPRHPLTLALLQQLDFPLAAPSANPFGYISPTEAAHVAAQLGNRIPYILDGGAAGIGVESTIVGMDEREGQVEVFRLGGMALEDIEALVGPVSLRKGHTEDPTASGMLKSHYAPGTRLQIGNPAALLPGLAGQRVGVLAFRQAPALPVAMIEVLSPRGDLGEAAQRLFGAMRRLDAARLDHIIAEPVPDHGLGRAINDRLQRASA
ncbi:MAG: L-threonylcarbamoyladenylate synthase, partial [Bacteroidetes bacterium]